MGDLDLGAHGDRPLDGEFGFIAPHAMQDNGKPAGQCDFGLTGSVAARNTERQDFSQLEASKYLAFGTGF